LLRRCRRRQAERKSKGRKGNGHRHGSTVSLCDWAFSSALGRGSRVTQRELGSSMPSVGFSKDAQLSERPLVARCGEWTIPASIVAITVSPGLDRCLSIRRCATARDAELLLSRSAKAGIPLQVIWASFGSRISTGQSQGNFTNRWITAARLQSDQRSQVAGPQRGGRCSAGTGCSPTTSTIVREIETRRVDPADMPAANSPSGEAPVAIGRIES
jgi:hypothetical protein